MNTTLIIVRGAGDLATGTILRLKNSGYKVIALETAYPTVIRRTVAFAEAVFSGSCVVEGRTGRLAQNAPRQNRVGVFLVNRRQRFAVSLDRVRTQNADLLRSKGRFRISG